MRDKNPTCIKHTSKFYLVYKRKCVTKIQHELNTLQNFAWCISKLFFTKTRTTTINFRKIFQNNTTIANKNVYFRIPTYSYQEAYPTNRHFYLFKQQNKMHEQKIKQFREETHLWCWRRRSRIHRRKSHCLVGQPIKSYGSIKLLLRA